MTYAALQSRAAAMIAAKGQTATITGQTAPVYNVATGAVTGTAYSASVKVVLLPLLAFRDETNSDVQAGDERMLISPLTTTNATLVRPPLNSTIVLSNGVKYQLVAIYPLHPDGTDLLFDAIVRAHA